MRKKNYKGRCEKRKLSKCECLDTNHRCSLLLNSYSKFTLSK